MTTNSPSDVTNPVSQDQFKKFVQDINYIFIAVIVVLAMGFITLLITVSGIVIDSHRFKAETYQNLLDKVTEQNTKIDILINGKTQSTSKNSIEKLPNKQLFLYK